MREVDKVKDKETECKALGIRLYPNVPHRHPGAISPDGGPEVVSLANLCLCNPSSQPIVCDGDRQGEQGSQPTLSSRTSLAVSAASGHHAYAWL